MRWPTSSSSDILGEMLGGGGGGGERERGDTYFNLFSNTLSNCVELIRLLLGNRLTELEQRLSMVVLGGVVFSGLCSLHNNVRQLSSDGAATGAPVSGDSAAARTGTAGICDCSTTLTRYLHMQQ